MSDKEKGLYRKYFVQKLSDISEDTKYFVLDINSDPYARPALRAYVEACREEYPLLAKDLSVWLVDA